MSIRLRGKLIINSKIFRWILRLKLLKKKFRSKETRISKLSQQPEILTHHQGLIFLKGAIFSLRYTLNMTNITTKKERQKKSFKSPCSKEAPEPAQLDKNQSPDLKEQRNVSSKSKPKVIIKRNKLPELTKHQLDKVKLRSPSKMIDKYPQQSSKTKTKTKIKYKIQLQSCNRTSNRCSIRPTYSNSRFQINQTRIKI